MSEKQRLAARERWKRQRHRKILDSIALPERRPAPKPDDFRPKVESYLMITKLFLERLRAGDFDAEFSALRKRLGRE